MFKLELYLPLYWRSVIQPLTDFIWFPSFPAPSSVEQKMWLRTASSLFSHAKFKELQRLQHNKDMSISDLSASHFILGSAVQILQLLNNKGRNNETATARSEMKAWIPKVRDTLCVKTLCSVHPWAVVSSIFDGSTDKIREGSGRSWRCSRSHTLGWS